MTSPTPDPYPLVSIVTPTFPGREGELFRCIKSVGRLDWPRVQHVIVTDRMGPSQPFDIEALRRQGLVWVELNETWRNATTSASTGSYPWMIGSRLAMGEFIGFLGDDDELLPHHVSRHVEAMRAAEAMFSVSQVQFRVGGIDQMIIGQADWAPVGSLDTTGVMCYKGALRAATWNANGNNAGDHQLVNDWLAAGLRGTFVPEVTGIHNDGWMAGKSGRPGKFEL